MKLNILSWVTLVLVVIGALNWALVGLFRFDLVAFLLGPLSILSRIVYVAVGVAGVYMLIFISLKKENKIEANNKNSEDKEKSKIF